MTARIIFWSELALLIGLEAKGTEIITIFESAKI
jgi:hypothetical protein